jgi:hydroxymethylpyrimidine pyrophosphatase-like HAD family hydrolase
MKEKRKVLRIKTKAYIFDIDGTISDHKERLKYYKNKDYDRYNFLCYLDDPIKEAIRLCELLSNNYYIIFLTGRPEEYRKKTIDWIYDNVTIHERDYKLIMRKEGDFRSSKDIKLEEYNKLKEEYNILGVFDDREDIIEMFKKQNLLTFKVN